MGASEVAASVREQVTRNWSFRATEAGVLQERGISGEGLAVAVVDPDINPISLGHRQVHGYGIGKLISAILPEANVML